MVFSSVRRIYILCLTFFLALFYSCTSPVKNECEGFQFKRVLGWKDNNTIVFLYQRFQDNIVVSPSDQDPHFYKHGVFEYNLETEKLKSVFEFSELGEPDLDRNFADIFYDGEHDQYAIVKDLHVDGATRFPNSDIFLYAKNDFNKIISDVYLRSFGNVYIVFLDQSHLLHLNEKMYKIYDIIKDKSENIEPQIGIVDVYEKQISTGFGTSLNNALSFGVIDTQQNTYQKRGEFQLLPKKARLYDLGWKNLQQYHYFYKSSTDENNKQMVYAVYDVEKKEIISEKRLPSNISSVIETVLSSKRAIPLVQDNKMAFFYGPTALFTMNLDGTNLVEHPAEQDQIPRGGQNSECELVVNNSEPSSFFPLF